VVVDVVEVAVVVVVASDVVSVTRIVVFGVGDGVGTADAVDGEVVDVVGVEAAIDCGVGVGVVVEVDVDVDVDDADADASMTAWKMGLHPQ